MSFDNPTPRPWDRLMTIGSTAGMVKYDIVADCDGRLHTVARGVEPDDAKLILEAVKAHDANRGLIKQLSAVLEDVKQWPYEMSQAKLNRINAALAQAKETQT